MAETVETNPAPKEDKLEAPDLLQSRTDFFIGELANYQQIQDRRYESLSRRLDRIEKNKKSFDEDDPTKAMMGIFAFIILMNVALPLLGEVISRWRSSSSPSLQLP